LGSLLTGGYPHTTGLRTLFDRLSPHVGTLAELFRSRGFHTVAVVSNHVLSRKRGLDRGFDVYEVSNTLRPARETREAVVRILSTTPMRRPLFLWVHYVDPHMPYVPEPATMQSFDPGYTGRYARGFGSLETAEGRQGFPADLPKPLAVYHNPLSEAVRAHIRRLYAAEIRQADDQIALMVAAIKQRFGEDGWIVFAADHGESLGEHDFYYDHGDYVYTPSLRVPLGFYAPREPRVAQGKVVPVWVSLVDVVPTLIELAALNLPKAQSGQVEGHSLVPWFGESKSSPHPVFAESGKSYFPHELRRRVHFDVAGRFRSVVDGSWQLIWTPGLAPKHRYELYDLDHDPHGEHDLYTPGNPRAARLAQQLHHWYRAVDSDESVPEADDLRMLRGLGYIK